MYNVSLGEMTLPVAPSKITMKTRNNNKTMELIDGSEINFLRSPGLTEYSFEFLIPHVKYPFAEYPQGFQPAKYFLDGLKKLKNEKKIFAFTVKRTISGGKVLFSDSQNVCLEDYTINEDSNNGLDFIASVTLKEYIERKTTNNQMLLVTQDSVIVKEEKHRDKKKDAPSNYTVRKGDSLWKICKAELGDGAKYKEIAALNGISNPNLIYPGQVIKFDKT